MFQTTNQVFALFSSDRWDMLRLCYFPFLETTKLSKSKEKATTIYVQQFQQRYALDSRNRFEISFDYR